MGMLIGYLLPHLFKIDRRDAVTIAIEVGMQNSGLAVKPALDYFSAIAALPGAVFSIWHNISGAIPALLRQKGTDNLLKGV